MFVICLLLNELLALGIINFRGGGGGGGGGGVSEQPSNKESNLSS